MSYKSKQALISQLIEYAGNSGYSHNDYADTMREAAAALASLDAQVQPEAEHHFDDHAVDCFAKMMKKKLKYSREVKGRDGWDDPEQCSVEYLNELLLEHVAKGDPVDVANLCMMLTHYQAKITVQPETFDTWINNPYTKVLQKSIAEDYMPKHAAPVQPASKPEVSTEIEKLKRYYPLWHRLQMRAGKHGQYLRFIDVQNALTRCATSSKEASEPKQEPVAIRSAYTEFWRVTPDAAYGSANGWFAFAAGAKWGLSQPQATAHPAAQPCQEPVVNKAGGLLNGKSAAEWYAAYCEISGKLKQADGCIGRYQKLIEDQRTTATGPEVAQPCRNSRDDVLEEAAKQCEDIYNWRGAFSAGVMYTSNLNACAAAIRALKSGLSQPCQSMSDAAQSEPAQAVTEFRNIDRVKRTSDFSVEVVLASCRAASEFERRLLSGSAKTGEAG